MKNRSIAKETEAAALVVTEHIARQILIARGHKVMIDADLAALYAVTTKRFNEQVKRNLARFPADFMFQLRETEHAALRSQIATSIKGRGGRRYLPYVFTEHGAIMAATILNSPRATEMSVFIVRGFSSYAKRSRRTRNSPNGSMSWNRAWSANSPPTTRRLPVSWRPSASLWPRPSPRRSAASGLCKTIESSKAE